MVHVKYKMIDKLLPYDAIGWDFDGTLIDHINAPTIHQFIQKNLDKRHIIITFRSHGLQRGVFREMIRKYPDAPRQECFVGVVNISDRAWERFAKNEVSRALGLLNGPLTLGEKYYVEWKGKICGDLQIPVLVDDRPQHVLPGCHKYGIDYVHPDEL